MKAIQVMFDETLLARLDAFEDVRRDGRCALLRRAAEQFLHRREQELIDERYRTAYEDVDVPDAEFVDWEHQGAWAGALNRG